MNDAIESKHQTQIYLFAVMASLLISFWFGYRENLINPDGICYLLSSQAVGMLSMKQAMHFCPQAQWPLYSTLIYGLTQVTHFSPLMAANILNGFFSLFTVLVFILIIKELGASSRVMLLAALVILFQHQLNVLRDDIIRDHGFWTFYLSSIYFLLRYFKQPKLQMAFAWNMSLVIATLFRIEGAIFLLLMPFIAWFMSQYSFKKRVKMFVSLNLMTLFVGIMIAVWFLFHPQESLNQLGRVNEIIAQMQNGVSLLWNRYDDVRNGLMRYILSPESTTDAGPLVILLWLSWYLYNVTITLSLVYAVLVIYAWKNKIFADKPREAMILRGYLLINFVVTFIFLAEHLFVSKRYLMALVLTLSLWIPFALDHLVAKWSSIRHRLFLSLCIVMMCISFLSSLIHFGYSKRYIEDAGNWIAKSVPAEASLYANDMQLIYYTHHFGMHLFEILPQYLNIQTISHGQWKQYDYLALRLGTQETNKMMALLNELSGLKPVKEFRNKRGNRVVIYQIKREIKH